MFRDPPGAHCHPIETILNLKHAIAALVVISVIPLTTFAAEPPPVKKTTPAAPLLPPVAVPIVKPAATEVYTPLTTANWITGAELWMKNNSGGTIVRFKVTGRKGNTDAKCVVLVTLERAPNAIHPKPNSIAQEYTLTTPPASVPVLVETISTNEGGDWTFRIKPVRDCTGNEFSFPYKIAFGAQESLPVIYGVGANGLNAYNAGNNGNFLTDGEAGKLAISGGGDMTNCKVEITVSGYVSNAGTKIVSMNGNVNYVEPFKVVFPAGTPKDTWSSVDVVLKLVSGCQFKPYDPSVNKKSTYPLYSGFPT